MNRIILIALMLAALAVHAHAGDVSERLSKRLGDLEHQARALCADRADGDRDRFRDCLADQQMAAFAVVGRLQRAEDPTAFRARLLECLGDGPGADWVAVRACLVE